MPANTHEPRYRWKHPMEWLRHSSMTYGDLLNFIQANCDDDQIQDYFQPDMEADGYFEDLDAPSEEEETEDGE